MTERAAVNWGANALSGHDRATVGRALDLLLAQLRANEKQAAAAYDSFVGGEAGAPDPGLHALITSALGEKLEGLRTEIASVEKLRSDFSAGLRSMVQEAR